MPKAQQCRLWLPQHLCARVEVSLALVGWVNVGQKYVDVVVVAACPVPKFSNNVFRSRLKELLDTAELKLPIGLRSERKLSVVGEYGPAVFNADHISKINLDREGPQLDSLELRSGESRRREDRVAAEGMSLRSWFQGSDPRTTSITYDTRAWAVVLACRSSENSDQLDWIPYLQSLSLEDLPVSSTELIVIYRQPLFGSHHFSCISWPHKSLGYGLETSYKETLWLTALNPQDSPDMEMVFSELNCSRYIDEAVKDIWPPSGNSWKHSLIHSIFFKYLWASTAVIVAVWATMLYALAIVFTAWIPTFPYLQSLLQKSLTCQAMHIRCQQLMSWPFILLWGGLGPEQPNVAIAHKMAVKKFRTWAVLLGDTIIGAVFGLLLLHQHATITQLVAKTGKILIDVLRTGCVWLMGVPAGFKLNNELSAVFGTLSIHLLQSWSALFSMSTPAVGVFLHILGIGSLFLGFTVLAAMVSDMIFLSTFYLACLHNMTAILYTNQLRALAALWRLFRGRKRNSLRRRLDTFDCSVEQLVVGSLMFTPLLLLLPTTSVFYTFFSLIFLIICGAQLLLHFMISTLHCFPFSLVATWIIRPQQFPCGVWFEPPGHFFLPKETRGCLPIDIGN